MLTKMRRRFIASAMAAMGAVTLVLLVAINLWNNKQARRHDKFAYNHRQKSLQRLVELHPAGHFQR